MKRVEISEGLSETSEEMKEVRHAPELVHKNLVRIHQYWVEEVDLNVHRLK